MNESQQENKISELSQETTNSLLELSSVLKRIHGRLLAEGYIIINGKIEKQVLN